MKQINLIPNEMTVPAKAVRLSSLLYKISMIGVIILVLSVTLLISGLVYYNIQYKQVTSNLTTLRSQIVALEKNEQKLILAKDRLSKILAIKKIDSVDDELTNFETFESFISSNSAFTDISIDSNKTETSLSFKNSSELVTALNFISSLKEYKKVVLSSLNYGVNSGYLISLIFNN